MLFPRYERVVERQSCVAIEGGDQAVIVLVRRPEIIGALWSEQSVSINFKFVLLGLATKNRMILKNQTLSGTAAILVKLVRGPDAREASADDDHVVFFAGVFYFVHHRTGEPIANQVRGLSY